MSQLLWLLQSAQLPQANGVRPKQKPQQSMAGLTLHFACHLLACVDAHCMSYARLLVLHAYTALQHAVMNTRPGQPVINIWVVIRLMLEGAVFSFLCISIECPAAA